MKHDYRKEQREIYHPSGLQVNAVSRDQKSGARGASTKKKLVVVVTNHLVVVAVSNLVVVVVSQNKTLQYFTVTSVAHTMLKDDAQPGVSSAIGVACSIISGKCVTKTINTTRATHTLKETDTRAHMEDHM